MQVKLQSNCLIMDIQARMSPFNNAVISQNSVEHLIWYFLQSSERKMYSAWQGFIVVALKTFLISEALADWGSYLYSN